MNKSNSPVDEKWIHSFAVTDCALHPKKFTVYKITSVVCMIYEPISVYQRLETLVFFFTRVTIVFDRFSLLKSLKH